MKWKARILVEDDIVKELTDYSFLQEADWIRFKINVRDMWGWYNVEYDDEGEDNES